MLSNIRRAVTSTHASTPWPSRAWFRFATSFACAVFMAGFTLPSLAQDADREWIPFEDPEAPAVQATHAVTNAKSSGRTTVGATSFSGTSKNPWEEYDKKVQASGVIGALGPDLFGDHVEYYKNTLSFSVTDISLPGNSALPVALTRKMEVVDRYAYHEGLDGYDHPLQDWDLDIPNISGVYAPSWSDTRCSSYAVPQPAGVSGYSTKDFWNGLNASMPGGGELLVPRVEDTSTPGPEAAPRPADGVNYPWMTAGFTYFRCLSNAVGNGTGEGFEAITTDGTKYTFGWMAKNDQPDLQRPPSTDSQGIKTGYAPLSRRLNALYVTRIEDRFGNTVTYTYDNSAGASVRLRRIEASDGRVITLDYAGGEEVSPGRFSGGTLSSASAHGRTWSYQYTNGSLSAVILPDSTRWSYDFQGLSFAIIEPDRDPLIQRNCNTSPIWVSGGGTGTVTHPSGAIGTFTVAPMRYGRSNVPKYCDNWSYSNNDPNDDIQVIPRIYLDLSISSKQISGPGIIPFEWEYSGGSLASWTAAASDPSYQPVCQQTGDACYEPVCVSDSCAGQHVTSVIGREILADGTKVVRDFQRLTFGNSYKYNEGKLLKVERGGNSSAILETEDYTYNLASSAQAFAIPIGTSLQLRHAGWANSVLRPQVSKSITRDGVRFVSTVNVFDPFARSKEIDRTSLIAPTGPVRDTKREITAYYDAMPSWVVGQVSKLSVDGIEASRTEFDSRHRPWKQYAFGLLQQTLGYDDAAGINGTLKTVEDGNQHTTTFSNWYRGVPKAMTLADNATTLSALVDDWGQVTQVTDENATVTNYSYDNMGRLWLIDYTDADSVLWNSNIQTFSTIGTAEYGLPPGTWKHTASTGTGRVTTWYNARWQPMLTLTEDTNNAATRSYVVTRYDSNGRAIFKSYPVATLSSVNDSVDGVSTQYDAIGRVTQLKQKSELGDLVTTMAYVAPFKTQVTNPRNVVWTAEYQTFDQPRTDSLTTLVAAVGTSEQQTTVINRDRFGKPNSITRSGAFGGSTISTVRQYVYDTNQRLCLQIEPESGTTAMDYDGAGNLAWSATGQTVTTCSDRSALNTAIPAGARTTRTYNNLNRLLTVDVPDLAGVTAADSTYDYYADGALKSLISADATRSARWDYEYNRRGMPVTEKLTYGGRVRTLTHEFNVNGFEYRLTYPSGQVINTVPNALGQATQAATYATGVTYFPNGGMSGFTYGNGIVHTLTQNTRRLPLRSLDQKSGQDSVLDDTYSYDPNGNVLAIVDATGASYGSTRQNITYDALDRLTGADAPGQTWIEARMTYDPFDNLRTHKAGSQDWTYAYDAAKNRLTSITNTVGGSLARAIAHDDRGNVVTNGASTYKFDAANRMTEVTGKERYFYDGHGRRVEIENVVGGLKSYPMYSLDGKLVADLNLREPLDQVHEYYYLNGSQVARRYRQNVTGASWTTRYVHTDSLGSGVVETKPDATFWSATKYKPYGEPSSYKQGPGYTGHVTDAATGLSYMQQRYYDPGIGRFLSVDPATAYSNPTGAFNRYWYANNNPLRFADPDGRHAKTTQELIDSGAEGCGTVSCAGWATLSAAWQVLGAEGVSEVATKGWSDSGGGKFGAALEVASVIPVVKEVKVGAIGVKAIAGKAVALLGKAQKTKLLGGPSGHAMRSLREAAAMLRSGAYDTVSLNRTLKTITEGGVNSRLRPDVAGLRPDGKIDITEVLSPGQKHEDLYAKYKAALGDLMGDFKSVKPTVGACTGTRLAC